MTKLFINPGLLIPELIVAMSIGRSMGVTNIKKAETIHPDILFIAIDDMNDWTIFYKELYDRHRDSWELANLAGNTKDDKVIA